MVYTGRPSSGCENCRKAKKRCDQGLPACGRCVRLGKACGGYRDLSQLMFRDESASVARRASVQSEASASTSASGTITRQPSPDKEVVALTFFYNQFVTASHISFLEGFKPDEFLKKSITACGLAGLANRERDASRGEIARQYYVDAISATNAALRHPSRLREDNTLISIFLLAFFERIMWERRISIQSWRNHVHGYAQVLQLRGWSQVRTATGAALFRELRSNIIINALCCETEVPNYIVQWTQRLEFDRVQSPADQLIILASRMAAIRSAYRNGDKSDEELAGLTAALDQDLLGWSEEMFADGSACSFYNFTDLDSQHAWNGTRHEYGIPQAHRHWNLWRSLRILLSRTQEAIWRRSWSTLSQPAPSSEHFRSIRNRMTADICVAAANCFGNDNTAEPARGSISSGYYLLIQPLGLAGTCLLEQLAEPVASSSGSRVVLVNKALHLDPSNETSVQLAWVIEKINYIAEKIGIGWATEYGKFLKGDCSVYYDLGRSCEAKENETEALSLGEELSLDSIAEIPDPNA